MIKYVIKRLLLMIPVILGISFIVFSIMSLTPGSPAKIILGDLASKESIEKLNEELGFNRPFLVRYFDYVKNALKGDFGRSYRTGLPVMKEIAQRFPTTIKLAFYSVLIATLVGIPVGIVSAVRQYSIIDSVSTILALIFISIPSFWLGLMLMLLFALHLGWFPTFGSETPIHFVLPALTTCASTLAILLRMTRSTMLEVIRQDYVRTARAKGATERRVILKHCLRNALIPIVTVIGVSFGYMLGGAIIAESVFGLSGIGQLMLNAVRTKDIPIVMATVLILALVFSMINLLLDIIYSFIDPRVKSQYQTEPL